MNRLKTLALTALGAVSAIAGWANGAAAADLFPSATFEPTDEAPAELGSGWYLRGDLGVERKRGSAIDVALTPVPSGSKDYGVTGAIGAGYKFNNFLRADLTFDFFKPDRASGDQGGLFCPYGAYGVSDNSQPPVLLGYLYNPSNTCDAHQSARRSRYGTLFNLYADLGTWSGITPYVGAGAGVTAAHTSSSLSFTETANGQPYAANLTPTGQYPQLFVDAFGNLVPQPTIPFTNTKIAFTQQNWNRNTSGTRYHFAWALMGGFAVDVSPNAKIDIGYRYVDLGRNVVVNANGTTSSVKDTSQAIRVGFRYTP